MKMKHYCHAKFLENFAKFVIIVVAAAGTFRGHAGAQTLAIGVESDFPLMYLGSYAPGGMVSASIATYTRYLGVKANVGGFCACQPHLSLSLEGSEATTLDLGRSWVLSPHLGGAVARSRPYQRMTDDASIGPNGEHMDTYLYAPEATSRQVFVGARAKRALSERQTISIAFGLIHEYQFDAPGLERREIRNCYEDDCPDSDKSGGGQWPDPKNAFYATFSYEWNVIVPNGGKEN